MNRHSERASREPPRADLAQPNALPPKALPQAHAGCRYKPTMVSSGIAPGMALRMGFHAFQCILVTSSLRFDATWLLQVPCVSMHPGYKVLRFNGSFYFTHPSCTIKNAGLAFYGI